MAKKAIKITWKVAPAPTGPYRSFEKRSWPTAYYGPDQNGPICADILCKDEYRPANLKEGRHDLLTLRIADHSQFPFKWRVVKMRFNTLEELKEALPEILERNAQFIHPDYKQGE